MKEMADDHLVSKVGRKSTASTAAYLIPKSTAVSASFFFQGFILRIRGLGRIEETDTDHPISG
jgi:hypothetical protein